MAGATISQNIRGVHVAGGPVTTSGHRRRASATAW